MIKLRSQVLIKNIESNGEHQGQTGTLVLVDPNMDGDFYGVQFAGESTIYNFYRTDFEVVSVPLSSTRA